MRIDLLQEFLRDIQRSEDAKFDRLHDTIQDLRQEQRSGFETIDIKMTKIADDLVSHEMADLKVSHSTDTRLASLETMHSTIKWFTRTAIGVGIAFVMDLVLNHLPRLFK